jgi:hypothetical protein
VLVDRGEAGKHGLIAVAPQLHTLIKQRQNLKADLQAERERDESVLVDEGRQACKHGLVAVAL